MTVMYSALFSKGVPQDVYHRAPFWGGLAKQCQS